MSTFISTLPYSSTILSSRQRKARLPKDMRTSVVALGTIATASAETASLDTPEKFYQDHLTVIFMGLYIETAMGPLLGALGTYLYSHWMM